LASVQINDTISYTTDVCIVTGCVYEDGVPQSGQKVEYSSYSLPYTEYVYTNEYGWFQAVLELNKFYSLFMEDCFDVEIASPTYTSIIILDTTTPETKELYNWLYASTTTRGVMT
jgi:hypothetical protein